MARIVFSGGSKSMAHNLDDLWERWMLRKQEADPHYERPIKFHLAIPDDFDGITKMRSETSLKFNEASLAINHLKAQRYNLKGRVYGREMQILKAEVRYWQAIQEITKPIFERARLAQQHQNLMAMKAVQDSVAQNNAKRQEEHLKFQQEHWSERRVKFSDFSESDLIKMAEERSDNLRKKKRQALAYIIYLQSLLLEESISFSHYSEWSKDYIEGSEDISPL